MATDLARQFLRARSGSIEDILEALVPVSKPSQADEDAGEVDKSLIDKAVVLMANDQAAEGADPGDGAFDFAASAVAAKLSTILCVRTYSAATACCWKETRA
jgi:hypothetical protein